MCLKHLVTTNIIMINNRAYALIAVFQLNDIEKVSDRILVRLNDYQQLKEAITAQKKTIVNMITETYNDWLKNRRSTVTSKSFRLEIMITVVYYIQLYYM